MVTGYGLEHCVQTEIGLPFSDRRSIEKILPVQVEDRFPVDLTDLPAGGDITPGTTWRFQWWYRDPAAGGAGHDFSDAVAVPFCN